MASKYVWGIYNPFQDFLLKAIMLDINVADIKSNIDINAAFTFILENYLEYDEDIAYLNYDIIEKDGYFKVIGNNSITAFWLSGIIPDDTATILKYNTLTIGNRKYVYDNKKKRLTYTILKN
jgi:hypothetical protein